MNIKVIAFASLVCALAAGGSAWQQRRAAFELEKQVASLKSAVDKKSAEIKEQETLVRQLRQQNNTYIQESAALREKLLARTPNTVPVESAVGIGPSPSPAISTKHELVKLFDDPKMKKVFRQQRQFELKQIYNDFVKERGLNPHQTEQFFDLLTDSAFSDMKEGLKVFSGEKDHESPKEAEDATELKGFDGQLRTLLGDANYTAYQAYERTIGDRMAMAQIREQIGMGGSPLRDDQAKTLLTVMTEERSRTPVAYDPDGPGHVREKMTALMEPGKADDYVTAQGEINQRILSRMAGMLSQEQYEAFERFLNQQLEMKKISLEFTREWMENPENNQSHSYQIAPGH